MDLSQIEQFIKSSGEPAYRHRQIVKNYFSGHFLSFLDMTDLPLSLRNSLEQKFSLLSLASINILTSTNTTKALLQLKDGLTIESVLMDYDSWQTVCLSSQVGCPLNCSFCATGKMGFQRNLTTEEIIDQIIFWKNYLYINTKDQKKVSRIVFMGMGEPFLNWDNFLSATKMINDKNYLNIGQRKISVSTAGIVDRIYDFADLNTEINLAVSLHSANQLVRKKIMPVAFKYPLPDLKKAIAYYLATTHRQVMLEYALIKDVNDSPQDVNLLSRFISGHHLLTLNLIPLNPVKNSLSASTKLRLFQSQLLKSGLKFTVRRSIGSEINSACGQLSSQKKLNPQKIG